MIGKTLAIAATLLLSTQVYAQTNTDTFDTRAAQGVTSGPAVGTPAGMKSPQAGPVATKHQRQVLRHHSRSVSNQSQQARQRPNDETGATGSSSPSYAPPPR